MILLVKGFTFSVGDGGAPTEIFSPVTDIVDWSPPTSTVDFEDTTAGDSASLAKTCAPTLISQGELTITVLTDGNDLVQQRLRTLANTRVKNNFKLHYAGSTMGTVDLTASVSKFNLISPTGGLLKTVFSFLIDGAQRDIPASVQALTITDTAGPAYITSETMTVAARFDEVVVVTGSPRVSLSLTSGGTFLTYTSGSGTNVLTFSKTFGGGDSAAATHVSISSPISLNGGTIKDQSGQAAVLTFTPPTTTTLTVN